MITTIKMNINTLSSITEQQRTSHRTHIPLRSIILH